MKTAEESEHKKGRGTEVGITPGLVAAPRYSTPDDALHAWSPERRNVLERRLAPPALARQLPDWPWRQGLFLQFPACLKATQRRTYCPPHRTPGLAAFPDHGRTCQRSREDRSYTRY